MRTVRLLGEAWGTFVMPRIGMMASLMIGTVSGSAARLALAIGAVHWPVST
jgi:hypothetical protein